MILNNNTLKIRFDELAEKITECLERWEDISLCEDLSGGSDHNHDLVDEMEWIVSYLLQVPNGVIRIEKGDKE